MATLVVTEGPAAGKSYPVERALILGREKGDVPIPDIAASREHAKIFSQDGDWFVIDLGSRNGTKVNGSRVSRWHLGHGDTITIGKTTLRFDAPEAARKEAPAAPSAPAAAAPARPGAPAAPRGPSAIERERERLKREAEAKRPQGARARADDGSGVVIKETVLQYGRIDDKGGLLREDVGQRGGLFKVALVLGLLALGAAIVWGMVRALDRPVVEDPDVPEEPAPK
jgi:pSer/pThr/pTyr-binding forkhead associated (FHA) protein